MNPRDAILAAVRRNLPRPAVPLPEARSTDRNGINTGLGYKEHFHSLPEVPGFPAGSRVHPKRLVIVRESGQLART
jgi:hypothetical protein